MPHPEYPACGHHTVHRPDVSGEHVRQAALQITANGCVCQSCRASWAPTTGCWRPRWAAKSLLEYSNSLTAELLDCTCVETRGQGIRANGTWSIRSLICHLR
ncbi:DUF7340 domain-containing protein [Nocardia xishanensis]